MSRDRLAWALLSVVVVLACTLELGVVALIYYLLK